MILKRNTRQAMFHFGLFFMMMGIMFMMGGYLLSEPIWFGLIIFISGIIGMITPIIFVIITPFEKLEKERKEDGGWGWKQ